MITRNDLESLRDDEKRLNAYKRRLNEIKEINSHYDIQGIAYDKERVQSSNSKTLEDKIVENIERIQYYEEKIKITEKQIKDKKKQIEKVIENVEDELEQDIVYYKLVDGLTFHSIGLLIFMDRTNVMRRYVKVLELQGIR